MRIWFSPECISSYHQLFHVCVVLIVMEQLDFENLAGNIKMKF